MTAKFGKIANTERVLLVTVGGIESVPDRVLDDLAVALLDITDRMRSGRQAYTVMVAESPRTDHLLRLLAEQNRKLASVEGGVGDTHPVPVIDHRRDTQAS